MLETVAQLTSLSASPDRSTTLLVKPGAAGAELAGPVVHELVDDELRPSIEQVDQPLLAVGRIEPIPIAVEGDHGKAPTTCGDPVEKPGGLLLGNEQLVTLLPPCFGQTIFGRLPMRGPLSRMLTGQTAQRGRTHRPGSRSLIRLPRPPPPFGPPRRPPRPQLPVRSALGVQVLDGQVSGIFGPVGVTTSKFLITEIPGGMRGHDRLSPGSTCVNHRGLIGSPCPTRIVDRSARPTSPGWN